MSLARSCCCLVLPACVLAVLPLSACADDSTNSPTNLLANDRFEQLDSRGGPLFWEAACDPGSIDAKLTIDAGPEGARAIKLSCARLPEAANSSHGMLAQRGKVRLEASRWYALTFWARQSGIVGGGVNIAIYRMRDFTNCGLNVTARLERDWRRFRFVFQATLDPGETGRFQIWYGESGTLWIADPTLAACPAPEPVYSPALPPAPGKNLVPNGSFEAGAGGWGSTADMSGWGVGGLDLRFGELDQQVACDGTTSFRIAVTPENTPVFSFDYYEPRRQPVRAPLLASDGWIAVQPGKPYTLSAMMKADRPGVVARMGLRGMHGARMQGVALARDWQRLSARIIPEQPRVYVALGPDLDASKLDATTVWIDAVQLEAGPDPTPFAPYDCMEVGFKTGRLGNLFDGREPIVVRATVSNQSSAGGSIDLTWRATDFFDKPAGAGQMTLALAPGRCRQQEIDTRITRPGFYRLFLTAQSGAHFLTREVRTASIERVPQGDSHVGMLGHGVEKLFYHYGAAGTINREDAESIFFEYAGAPRKMLPAQAVFCHLVPGSRRILKIADLHLLARTYLFGDPRGKVLIAWIPEAGDDLRLHLADRRLSAVDIMGSLIDERMIALSEAPVYVTGPASMSVEEFLEKVKVGE